LFTYITCMQYHVKVKMLRILQVRNYIINYSTHYTVCSILSTVA